MRLRTVGLLLPLLVLAGCPEPVDELPASAPGAGQAGGAPPAGAGGEAVPPPPGDAAAGAPSTDASGQPGAPTGETPPGAPVPPADLATRTLASLAEGGATVKIRGTLKGGTKAQVDFTAVTETNGQKMPEILQIVQVTDGTFEVEAPATYDREIWVSASVDEKGDGITPDDPGGLADKPVKLAGKDVTVEIKIGKEWATKLPWSMGEPPAGGMPPGGAAVPPPPDASATPAAGASTDGAPPTGAAAVPAAPAAADAAKPQ